MKRDFSLLAGHQFDLLVCGGGIYGAWTAYDAALRGLRVAIVEQGDWACATSSASSKLIHGGLRYLETLDFKLVRKALAERKMLLEVAPHRVWPLRFGVPVYADSRIGSLRLKAGLTLYDFMAGFPVAEMSYRHFRQKLFSEHFPCLNIAGLRGGFTYGDAQTDDARLVLELIAGAMNAGAVCVNYCKLTGLSEATRSIETKDRVSRVTVQDQLTHAIAEISARQIVYTTGQWTAAAKPGREWCRLSKGIHLVMPALPGDEALLLTAQSDGRVFFIIPWYGMTLLGTTDTDYRGDVEHIGVEPEEVAYLLTEANHYLNTAWTESNVVGRYAGVRVMKLSEKSSSSAVSRDWELKTASNSAHYSIGGKITSARVDAACIVDAVCAQLDVNVPCPTTSRPFPWSPEGSYAEWSAAKTTQAVQLGIDQESVMWLLRRHGKRADEVLRMVGEDVKLAERITLALPFIYADLLFCAREEMAIHLHDLLRRRMPLLILAKLDKSDLRRIAATVAPIMGWDEDAITSEIEASIGD
ncbi:MAG: glycerol-3-phosphate dehydrogenase/oxidase [Gallionella sp.]